MNAFGDAVETCFRELMSAEGVHIVSEEREMCSKCGAANTSGTCGDCQKRESEEIREQMRDGRKGKR